jgi:hypothetical protein
MTEAVSLTGRLLVATPALTDPNFDRAVVLLLDHDAEGTLGVVLNRPTGVEVGSVLESWGGLAGEPAVVFQGGPVALDSALGLAVVPGEWPAGEFLGWRRVHGAIGLVDLESPPELLARAAGGRAAGGHLVPGRVRAGGHLLARPGAAVAVGAAAAARRAGAGGDLSGRPLAELNGWSRPGRAGRSCRRRPAVPAGRGFGPGEF